MNRASRMLRWIIALGVTVFGFALGWWIGEGLLELDQATALTLATAAGPLLATPFAWWATQPIAAPRARPPAFDLAPDRSPYAFLCYSHADSADYVERLGTFLIDAGIPVWFDREIISGHRWSRVIQQRIEHCVAVIAVMTPEADRSGWVERELAHAEGLGKPVLPLLLSGRPFFALSNLHYEDVTGGRMPSRAFIGRLRELVGAPAEPAPVITRAAEPAPVITPAPQDKAPDKTQNSKRPRRRALAATAAAMAVIAAGVTTIAILVNANQEDPVSPGSFPSNTTAPGLAVSPDGQRLYVAVNRRARDGRPWPRGSLVTIDTTNGTFIGNPLEIIAAPDEAVVSPRGDRVYVSSQITGDMVTDIGLQPVEQAQIPLTTGEIRPSHGDTDTERTMVRSPDGSRLYVADIWANTVTVVDTAGRKTVGTPITVNKPRHMVLSPDGKRLYVTNYNLDSTVTVIDTTTGAQDGSPFKSGGAPGLLAVSPDGRRLYVADLVFSAGIEVYDTATRARVKRITPPCDFASDALVVGKNGDRLYVACSGSSHEVAVIDPATGAPLNTGVNVGNPPSAMVLSPDGSRLYVATHDDTYSYKINIEVIDTATHKTIGETISLDSWRVDE